MIREEFEHGGFESAGGRPDRLAYATLDALSEHVAVLDERGTVVAVNRAWRDFAAANASTTRGLVEGANYFDACESAEGEGAECAARFADGLRAIISGGLDEFTLEYPCHAPAHLRWFVARATRFALDGAVRAVVIHTDITKRKLVEEELHDAYDELELRVEERTSQLEHANETLKAENAERLRAEESRRELLGRLVMAQEEERRSISRELHDRMGQQLAALMMGLKTLGSESYGRRSALDTLRRLEEMSDELSREVHTLAWGLRPPALDDLGLETALYNYVEEWAERSRVPVDFHSAGFGDGRLPLTHETALYRIAQEALTNVAKHSGADRVSFILERRGDHVLAVIEDNGSGFDVEAASQPSGRSRRLGLLGMRERAALLGGTINVESEPDVGTTLFVRIPFEAGVEGEGRRRE